MFVRTFYDNLNQVDSIFSSEVILSYQITARADYNPRQNIWNKIEKFSETGQYKKSFISNFACFLTAFAKV